MTKMFYSKPLLDMGLQKSLEIVTQLRGHAGKRQVSDAKVGIAQAWRGIPTGSGAMAIFKSGGS